MANPDTTEQLVRSVPEANTDAVARVGYFGGPGPEKGWDLVAKSFASLRNVGKTKIQYVLFDAGGALGSPWYGGASLPSNVEVRSAFHWAEARSVFSALDVVVVPSRVRESFGLVPREMISSGGQAVIFPSGALKELDGYYRVHVAQEATFRDGLINAVRKAAVGHTEYAATTSVDYAMKLLSL